MIEHILNPDDLKQLLLQEPVFERIVQDYGAPNNWQRPEGFESLVKIILEQQVSLQSAKAHFNRLNAYLTDFTPEEIVKLSPTEFRNCYISTQKSTYLLDLSNAIVKGTLDLNELPTLSDAEVSHELSQIKGIGRWTCDIYLMMCLQRKDIFPIGDLAVRKAITALFGISNKDAIQEFSEQWKPRRSLAVFILWRYYLKNK